MLIVLLIESYCCQFYNFRQVFTEPRQTILSHACAPALKSPRSQSLHQEAGSSRFLVRSSSGKRPSQPFPETKHLSATSASLRETLFVFSTGLTDYYAKFYKQIFFSVFSHVSRVTLFPYLWILCLFVANFEIPKYRSYPNLNLIHLPPRHKGTKNRFVSSCLCGE